MKKLAILAFVLFGCGDVGSSDSQTTVNAGGGDGGNSSAVFDPIPTTCNVTCSVTSSGTVTATQNCEGGTVTTYTPPTLDDCDSIFAANQSEPEE